MKRIFLWGLLPLSAATLIGAGYLLGTLRSRTVPGRQSSAPDQRVLYWYDPMIPTEHHDQPGLSSMGMKMIPKYADNESGSSDVRIDPDTLQNLGLRTARVTRRVLTEAIRAPGTVSWDLNEASVISARADGVITRLIVRAPYTSVPAGAPLAELTAPAWSSAVAEYTALSQARSTDAQALHGAARERLRVLGLESGDLRSVGRYGAVTLHAPQRGTVTTIEVREGQRVSAGQTLMTINGLDKVWVEASLSQAAMASVQPGSPVSVSVDARPGQIFQGTVDVLLPDIDSTTRATRARIVVSNADGVLSPGMFAHITLNSAQGDAVPVIPDEALITTGSDARVIVQDDSGHFRPVAVHTGRSVGGYTQVIEGLHEGERVVTSGQFLIDSEASLSGALDRLDHTQSSSTPATSATAPMPMNDKPSERMP
jgi:membrane fusion protein, copper/silver efflux system